MMKNTNWKKYVGAAMAAAMIPAAVAPIATEAAELRGLADGWNIKMTVDGKASNHLLKNKTLRLVDTTDSNKYYSKTKKSLYWVPAGGTYYVYDITDTNKDPNAHKGLEPKGQITVYPNGGTTIANLKYSTVYETKTVNAADFGLMSESTAYYEDKTGNHFGIKGIYASQNAKLIVNQKQTSFKNSIEAHAPAKIKYDLTGKNIKRFTGLVGLDERRNSGAVKVEVLVNGQPHSSFVQKKGDEAKSLDINLTGANTLEFIVKGATEAKNSNENALFVLANGQFEQQVETIK